MAGTPQGFPHIALHLTPQILLDIRIWGVAQGGRIADFAAEDRYRFPFALPALPGGTALAASRAIFRPPFLRRPPFTGACATGFGRAFLLFWPRGIGASRSILPCKTGAGGAPFLP